jgi:hypothetical protein
MTQDALKSPSITNLDATSSPFVVATPTAGVGGPALQHEQDDFVTPTTGGLVSTSSLYKMLRLPTGVKLKSLSLTADAALDTSGSPVLAFDVGAYYSDSAYDGTPVVDQGVQISTAAFGSAVAFGASTNINAVNMLAALTVAKRQLPLWDALGLASDPGGFIDIVLAVHTAAATAASHPMALKAEYVYG